MVWVIEECIAGVWSFVRHSDGMPLMYDTKRAARAALGSLPPGRAYRVNFVKD